VLGVVGARVVLSDFLPIAPGDVVEPQACARGLGLRNQLLRSLALGGFYFFGFASRRLFSRAVKPMTSEPEIEVEVWRARLAVGGHGTSLRV
jgi:hypothetical protein